MGVGARVTLLKIKLLLVLAATRLCEDEDTSVMERNDVWRNNNQVCSTDGIFFLLGVGLGVTFFEYQVAVGIGSNKCFPAL
jgi:hypothetical protein